MQIEPLTMDTGLKHGDLLLIEAPSLESGVASFAIKEIKLLSNGEEEIILSRRKNIYFNLHMYLVGESWAKDVRTVRRG